MPSRRPDISAAARPVQPAWAAPVARLHRALLLLWLGAAAIGAAARPAPAADPIDVLRAFAQADGRGARLSAGSWNRVAPLVGWGLEPAWDSLSLISGFEVGSPRPRDGAVDVDVQYSVVADVDAHGMRRVNRVETRTLTLEPTGSGAWRLRAPAPPPYIFESEADGAALGELLDPANQRYISNSGLVWSLLRDAGWDRPHANTAQLPTTPGYSAQRTANIGDLALYYDHGVPYHVGIVDSDDTIVSSTLNGGVRRTPFGAFAGEIRYLRPVDSDETAAPPTAAARDATPAAAAAVSPAPERTP
jgi:hypothetical protein